MINKLFALLKEENKGKVYILIILLFVAAMLEMLGVGLIMPFIAIIQSPDMLEQHKWFNLAYKTSHAKSHNEFIILCSVLILVFYLIKNLAVGWVIYLQSKFLAKTESECSTSLLNNYLSMPYEKFLLRNTAELVNNITMETSILFTGLIKPFFIVISDTLVVMTIFALLLCIAPAATIAATFAIVTCSFTFYIMLRHRLKTLGSTRQHHREKMVQWVNQSLGSLKEIIVLNRKGFFVNSFWQHAYEMIGQQTFYETVTQLPRLVIESFGVIVLVIITIILLKNEHNFLPTIALFAMAAFRLMPAINRITSSATKVKYYKPTLDALYKDLLLNAEKVQIYNNNDYKSAAPPSLFTKQVIINDISYAYPGSESQVLQNLNLEVNKGESVGIIGASGSGKSTLVDILLGLLTPHHGQILVDSKDIAQHLLAWRKHISYMPQVVYLNDDTVKRNVALGISDEEIDDALVWKSLEKAQAADFVRDLDYGLDTYIGERGSRLSGGQRQRLGIARALYNNPDILILDEATTALDPETEARICTTLKEIAKDITIIAISHQPALIKIANKVYKMEGGKLILEGR